MATNTAVQGGHWKDRLIAKAEAISDGFDVAKAYGAHIANWVLFFCLVANLIEMISPAFQAFAGMTIVGVQSISLDVAGFGLTAMAASARRRGDRSSAIKADVMGWTLISVMAITVGMVTLAAFKHEWAEGIEHANQVLMFVRVIVTVFYGHIVHQIREASDAHENRLAELETQVSNLQKQLRDKEQEIASAQGQLSTGQKNASGLQQQLEDEKEKASSLQHKFDLAQQRLASLETELEAGNGDTASLYRDLNAAKMEAEILRGKLDLKTREIEAMSSDQAGILDIRRELNTVKFQASDLQAQLEAKQQALKNEQLLVANLRREVERLSKNEAKLGASRRENEAKNEAKHHASSNKNEAAANVINLNSAFASKKALLAEVYRLADEEKLSSYEIEARINKPAKTIQRWLRDRDEANNEAESEATGTDE